MLMTQCSNKNITLVMAENLAGDQDFSNFKMNSISSGGYFCAYDIILGGSTTTLLFVALTGYLLPCL